MLGAPAQCLWQHPQIKMAKRKEMHFFGSDLVNPAFVRNIEDYLSYFGEIEGRPIVGEASVSYLYSKLAASEIYEFNPRAKIIIMLRNPIEVLRSLHSQLLWNGMEDVEDFKLAISLENERAIGKSLPLHCKAPFNLMYLDRVLFYKQIKRYFEVFPADQIHTIFYDDFSRDVAKVCEKCFDFLDVDSRFNPIFSVVNPNKVVRSKIISNVMKNQREWVRVMSHIILSNEHRHSLRRFVRRLNTKKSRKSAIEFSFQRELSELVRDDVIKLGEFMDRDLSGWLEPRR